MKQVFILHAACVYTDYTAGKNKTKLKPDKIIKNNKNIKK